MRTVRPTLLCALGMLCLAISAPGEVSERELKVTFVSTELVYLNGGRAEGLYVGAKPVVFRDDQRIVELEVQHLAEHSSACRQLDPVGSVLIGDVVRFTVESKVMADTISEAASHTASAESQSQDEVDRQVRTPGIRPDATGSIAVMYSNWDDHGDAGLDFSQGRIDVDFRAEPLWTPGLSFALRTSGRQDRRAVATDGTSNDSWESRIATFSLEYKRDGSRVGMSMGRINPARVGAIGRLDGASFEYRLTEPLRIGAFGGANSQWQYAENRPDLQTFGAYTGFRSGSSRDLLLDQTISLVGQYHGGVASREVVFSQGRIMRNGRWYISHSAEIDVNRGWRKTEAGSSFNLSTVFAQGRVNLTRQIAATLSYDTRKSYRTYETRDVADSIFDDRVRQGVRAQLDINVPAGIVVSGGAGLRAVAGESEHTVSYNAAVRKQGLFDRRSSLNLQAITFAGETTEGYNLNASLGQGFRQRDWFSLGAGLYSYKLQGESTSRVNRRADLTVRVGLTQALSVNALGQVSGGDDTRGLRLEGGLSLQF